MPALATESLRIGGAHCFLELLDEIAVQSTHEPFDVFLLRIQTEASTRSLSRPASASAQYVLGRRMRWTMLQGPMLQWMNQYARLLLLNTDLDRQLKHPFWTAEACRIRIVVHWQVSPTSAAG